MLESLDSESGKLYCGGCHRRGHLEDFCASKGGAYYGHRSAALNAQAAFLVQKRVEQDNKDNGWKPEATAVPSAQPVIQQQLHVQTRLSQAVASPRSDKDRLNDQYDREEDQRPSLGADRVQVQHVTSRLGPPLNRAVESTPNNQFKECIQQLDVHRDVQAREERTGPGTVSYTHLTLPTKRIV